MADIEIIQDPEDDTLELGEAPADTQAAADDGAAAEPLDTEDFPDTFDEAAGEETPLVKLLRDQLKDRTRELRRVSEQSAKPKLTRTPEPDLWDDCEGDSDKFKTALLAWQANEAKVDAQEQSRSTEQQQAAQSWQQELQAYKTKAVQLGKPDFETAEAAVVNTLTDAQQVTIVQAAKDPARFIYALGRSPLRLTQLASISNPIKLAAEVARIEGARVMARQSPPNIDEPVRGSARLSTPDKSKEVDAAVKKVQNGGELTPEIRATLRAARKAA